MTTIVFKDGVLAVDTRTTSGTHYHCLECGNNKMGRDDSFKLIEILNKVVLFKNEPVIVAAAAGYTDWCVAMGKALKEGKDIIEFNLIMRSAMRMDDYDKAVGEIIIVTEKHVWIYRPREYNDDKMLSCEPLTTDKTISMGSGEDYAYLAGLLGHSAVHCVRMAGICDMHTSLIVNYLDINNLDQDKTKSNIKKSDFSSDKTNYKS